MDYPKEWDELPRRERKKKLKALKREHKEKSAKNSKNKNIIILVIVIAAAFGLYFYSSQNKPDSTIDNPEFKQEVEDISLDGKVEEQDVEGSGHVGIRTEVDYSANPPTSGDHFSQAEKWGIRNKEIDDRAAVHSLEHGGIWISYKDISEEDLAILKEVSNKNKLSVLLSPRESNDVKIAVASWGRVMKLEEVDAALIQKYIDTYKNESPEKLAR